MASVLKRVIKKSKGELIDSESSANEEPLEEPEVMLAGKKRSHKEKNLLAAESSSESEPEKASAAKKVDSEDELRAFKDPEPTSKEWKNRQRTMVLCSRGLGGRFRHLVNDLLAMVPNTKKEHKVNRKDAADIIDDMCFEKSCNNYLYFEQHKLRDLFLWTGKSPSGPSIKFYVTNIHTTDELKLMGNCLQFSRPLLSFDKGFDESPHMKVVKEMLAQIFNTPKNHPKSKPFIDHVLSFNCHDGRIWMRAYQIMNQHEEKFTERDDIEKLVLIEIGPRMTLQPIKIFADTVNGAALWQNKDYITPNSIRSKKYEDYLTKRDERADRQREKAEIFEAGKDSDSYLSNAFDEGERTD